VVGAQSGVEVAVFLKKAMEEAGVTSLSQLPAPAVCVALREYEIVRSRRVSFIIKKAARFGATIQTGTFLVRATATTLAGTCGVASTLIMPYHDQGRPLCGSVCSCSDQLPMLHSDEDMCSASRMQHACCR
jgi:hypothetical protein